MRMKIGDNWYVLKIVLSNNWYSRLLFKYTVIKQISSSSDRPKGHDQRESDTFSKQLFVFKRMWYLDHEIGRINVYQMSHGYP